jgi:hypothetical protein
MKPAENKVVLYADMLGFASLTEEHPIDLDQLAALEKPALTFASILSGKRANRLMDVFRSFHHRLKWAVEGARMSYPFTAISFSDSAFIAMNNLHEAVGFAVGLIQSLLDVAVPIRIGVAHGTFSAVRFRSDLTTDSGEHAAHFLGTGVVRAHAAEGCGVKGMRILLHPSAVALLGDNTHNPPDAKRRVQCLQLPEAERENKAKISHEVDYWPLQPTARAKAWHCLQDMWDAAPEAAQIHYMATAQAIDRMRISHGSAPLKNLRRRTLPRE